jgi:hypothetical protein
MPDVMQFLGQGLVYAALAAGVGFLSSSPDFRQFPEGQAQIKLSFRHGGNRVEDCRRLTSQEIAQLPAKERRPNTCNRERVAVVVRLLMDGNVLYDETLRPTGLSGDGPAETYQKFIVPAGPHRIEAYLRDSKRTDGFDYHRIMEVNLKPLQSLAIDFKADQNGFLIR